MFVLKGHFDKKKMVLTYSEINDLNVQFGQYMWRNLYIKWAMESENDVIEVSQNEQVFRTT